MTIQEITNRLQDIGHSGEADKTVYIQILDAFYKIGKIQRVISGDKTAYVIKADKMGGSDD